MNTRMVIGSYESFVKQTSRLNENAEDLEDLNIDTTILDELVDLVGDEAIIEDCAKEALEELEMALGNGEELEVNDNDTPENLAIAALIAKLVANGYLDPQQADDFLEKYI